MSNLHARLDRLEERIGGGAALDDLIFDELLVMCLDGSRAVLTDPDAPPAERQRAEDAFARIEARIREHGEGERRGPAWEGYAAWVADSHGIAPEQLVRSIGGCDYEDRGKPNVMARRAAVRARADVAALLGV